MKRLVTRSLVIGTMLLVGASEPAASQQPFGFGDYAGQFDQLADPVAVVVDDASQFIYVLERVSGTVRVIAADLQSDTRWGARGSDPGELLMPGGLALHDDEVFIADTGNHRIQVFAPDGTYLRQWGEPGNADGQLRRPTGIAVTDDRVLVCDSGNDRVQIFDHDGRHLRSIGQRGEGAGHFRGPIDVAIGPDGWVYVTDAENHRVQIFDPAGTALGVSGEWGPFPGFFDDPAGITFHDDRIYVMDRRNHRVQAIGLEGEHLATWGVHELTPHEGNGALHYPDDLAIAPSGEFAVIVESIEDRLQMFTRAEGEQPEWRPSGSKQNRTHFGAHVDVNDRMMTVVEPENHFLFMFDAAHESPLIINKFGERGEGTGLLIRASGVCMDYENRRVLLTDVVKRELQEYHFEFDPDGAVKFRPHMTVFARSVTMDRLARRSPRELPYPIEPTAIARDQHGNLHMLDAANACVLVLDDAFDVLRVYGGTNDTNGALRRPVDLSFSRDGRITYIVDGDAACVHQFNADGNHVGRFGTYGEAEGEFLEPFGIEAGYDGFVYITDAAADRINKFDESGTFITRWGERGDDMGSLWGPRGIDHDPEGRLTVIDHGNHRAQVFTTDGRWRITFGAGRAIKSTDPRIGR